MRTIVRLLALTVSAIALAAPSTAVAGADEGWHPVHEPWQPHPEADLELPAASYCGDFDVVSTPVFQGVRSRVVSRWDSGGVRDSEYAGPLIVKATNQASEKSVLLNLSGRAETRQRPDGSLAVYETLGPVGFGWPTGSIGLPQGFYVFRGRHVVEFPVDGPRQLVVDRGPETDVCALLR